MKRIRLCGCACVVGLVISGSALAEPNPVNFTSASLPAGPLDTQPGWRLNVQVPANANFVIRPGAGLELTDNTAGSHAAAYIYFHDEETPLGRDTFDAGLPLSTSANFYFKQEPGPKKGRVFGLGWGLFVPVGPNNMPFFAEFARDTASGGYRLRIVKGEENTKIEGEAVLIIPEEAVGLSPTNSVSDPLQLSLTLTNLGEKSDWEAVTMLANLKTKKSFVLKNAIQAPGVYKIDNFLRGMVNLRRAGEDGLSSVIVTEIDAETPAWPSGR